uniref:Putative secreted protein n=1 Tax=Anopheles darlingi TaxID=43151 RepID=A0A2M4DJ66_ANODA
MIRFTTATSATIAAIVATTTAILVWPPALPQPQHMSIIDQEDRRLASGVEIILSERIRRRTVLHAQRRL